MCWKAWFKPWRTISGRSADDQRTISGHEDAPAGLTELQVVLEGVFEKRRFLDLVRYFIVFEDLGGGTLVKKMAGYHQFHAVNVAVDETLRAAAGSNQASDKPGGGNPGDRRVGVVWHTQGLGKSLSMAFYAGRVILHPTMKNPTIVVLTDRNDLDDQLLLWRYAQLWWRWHRAGLDGRVALKGGLKRVVIRQLWILGIVGFPIPKYDDQTGTWQMQKSSASG